jgi:hypothetical protein
MPDKKKNIVYFTRDEKEDLSIWKADIYPILQDKEDYYLIFDNIVQKILKESINKQDIINSKHSLSFWYVHIEGEPLREYVLSILTEEKRPDKPFVLVEEKHGELV